MSEHAWSDEKNAPPSLRDLFAAFAAAGILAGDSESCFSSTIVAGSAYDVADEMLAARKETQP
jgi:hypothetical protein